MRQQAITTRYEVSEELAAQIVQACERQAHKCDSFRDKEEMQSWMTTRAFERATQTGCTIPGLLAKWARKEFFTYRRKNRRDWTLTATPEIHPARTSWSLDQDAKLDREAFARI